MKVFSVSELTLAIKNLLEPGFRGISLQGEISNFKLQSSGHLYFSLKDAGAQISAAMFRSSAASMSRMPKEGDQVIVKGEVSLYMPRGQYQIVVRSLEFLGQGELLLKLQELKRKLQERGWFEKSHKKELPKFPKKIGVVTSPTGAVIQDILNVLNRRFSGFNLLLNPVKVQGPGSAEEIARAIEVFNEYHLADVLIIGRGGGSIEDLWAFNEEIVAKAIYESKIPIVAAVGHETDVTIADFVADVRAPTPSAAAEMVVAEKASILKFLESTRDFLYKRVTYQIHQSRQHLEAYKRHPLLSSPSNLLEIPMQRLDDIRLDLDLSLKRFIQDKIQKIDHSKQKLSLLNPLIQIQTLSSKLQPFPARFESTMRAQITERKRSLATISEHLRSLNPKNLLKKGYSLLQKEDGSVIFSAKELKKDQSINIQLHDGFARAKTSEIHIDDTK